MVLALTALRDAAQQPDGVGVPRVLEDFPCRALFDELTGVHHPDPVAHLRDHREVVADEQDRGLELLAQRRHEVEDLGLDSGIERRRRFVEDEERRLGGKRHGDHDALLHATGKLVRVDAQCAPWVGDLDHAQHLLGARQSLRLPHPGDLVHLGQLESYTHRRVESSAGLLVHHRDRTGAELAQGALVHGGDVLPVDGDRASAEAAVPWEVASDREGGGGLAAARLADETERLLSSDSERDIAQRGPVGASHAVSHVKVAHLESRGRLLDGGGHVGGSGKCHWMSTASIESPMRLTAMTSDAIASAGKSVCHQ